MIHYYTKKAITKTPRGIPGRFHFSIGTIYVRGRGTLVAVNDIKMTTFPLKRQIIPVSFSPACQKNSGKNGS